LAEIGLQGFLKTTGGKGLHIVIPIEPTLRWDAIKAFSKAIADLLTRTFPDRFTAKMSKASRTGKIFVDYLRNG
jgi:bifunctional non-homologous end joining protein LigD